MVTQVRDDRAIDEFARNVGEWLLAQRIGGIVPCSYRHRLWLPPPDDPDDLPHVEIDLTVEDPYPSPGEIKALEAATRSYALSQDVPPGIKPMRPTAVRVATCSEVEEMRRRRGL